MRVEAVCSSRPPVALSAPVYVLPPNHVYYYGKNSKFKMLLSHAVMNSQFTNIQYYDAIAAAGIPALVSYCAQVLIAVSFRTVDISSASGSLYVGACV